MVVIIRPDRADVLFLYMIAVQTQYTIIRGWRCSLHVSPSSWAETNRALTGHQLIPRHVFFCLPPVLKSAYRRWNILFLSVACFMKAFMWHFTGRQQQKQMSATHTSLHVFHFWPWTWLKRSEANPKPTLGPVWPFQTSMDTQIFTMFKLEKQKCFS